MHPFLQVAMTGLALTAAAAASASVVTGPVFETFDDPTTDFTLVFDDEDNAASGTGPSTGVAPGWTIQNGQAVFYNNSNFFDVGTALVSYAPAPAAVTFNVSADFDVFQTSSFASGFNYTTADTGVLAYADANVTDSDTFGSTGIYAYVKEINTSGGTYEFRIAINGVVVSASAATFDLTDGTPDFSIDLAGTPLVGGDLSVVATLTDENGANSQVLSTTVLAADLPGGDQFGVRLAPGFNGYEVGVDNVAVVVPEPASLALALGGIALMAARRRR
ncbi:MAG: PEP-CTERM sorting domain-containing protein [Planctomycetota bacterium]